MRQALSYDKSKSSALPEHYGDILFELGEYFMARTYWSKALELGADKAAIEERIERARIAEQQKKEQQQVAEGSAEKASVAKSQDKKAKEANSEGKVAKEAKQAKKR